MASPEHYVWAVPGKPVSVHLGADAVRQLEATLPADGVGRADETGGFLLGRVRQVNDVWIVAVEAVEFASCKHREGGSWTLSRSDRNAFGRQLQRLSKRGVVGWFRTHTRPGLYLDQHDFQLFREFFPHPGAVVLAVRPDAKAGFFFWEKGDVHRSRPYATFTCRSLALGFAEGPSRKPVVAQAPASANFGLRKELVWIPVAAGIGFAALWTPSVPFELRTEQPAETSTRNRPVFAPPPEPEKNVTAIRPAMSVTSPPRVEQEPRPVPLPAPVQSASAPVVPVSPAAERPIVPSVVARTESPRAQATRVPEPAPAPPQRSTPTVPAMVATAETPKPHLLKRAVGTIPGLGFLKKTSTEEGTTPAVVARQVRPSRFSEPFPVKVKVRIDKDGYVRSAHLMTEAASAATANSVIRAARGWKFTPARQGSRPVESEMVLTFRPDGGT